MIRFEFERTFGSVLDGLKGSWLRDSPVKLLLFKSLGKRSKDLSEDKRNGGEGITSSGETSEGESIGTIRYGQ